MQQLGSSPAERQSAADPNDVTVYFEVADLERARAFTQSPDLAAAMQAAGVAGPPQIEFLSTAQSYPS